MSEDKLTSRLTEFMSRLSFEPSKQELTTAVKNVYNNKKKAEKEDKQEKPKRKLSAWNIFYKEQSAILKQQEAEKDKEDRMSAKEKMAYIANLWKEKQSSGTEEQFVEAAEEPQSEAEAEPEEEEPMAKTSKKPSATTDAKKNSKKEDDKKAKKDDGKKSK
jgi:hypothetical protein